MDSQHFQKQPFAFLCNTLPTKNGENKSQLQTNFFERETLNKQKTSMIIKKNHHML